MNTLRCRWKPSSMDLELRSFSVLMNTISEAEDEMWSIITSAAARILSDLWRSAYLRLGLIEFASRTRQNIKALAQAAAEESPAASPLETTGFSCQGAPSELCVVEVRQESEFELTSLFHTLHSYIYFCHFSCVKHQECPPLLSPCLNSILSLHGSWHFTRKNCKHLWFPLQSGKTYHMIYSVRA